VGEIQAHQAVVRLQERGVDGKVGRRPGVRLHIDAPFRGIQMESLQRPLLRDGSVSPSYGGSKM
jgi:hypothetical protein